MGDILLYMALALVLLWTARLAKSKSRSPWLWGGVGFILMLIPNLNLLGVIPMIILLFIKSPGVQRDPSISPSTCPKCETASVQSSRFCTSCGWELSSPYTRDVQVDQVDSTTLPADQPQDSPEVIDTPVQEPADHEVAAPAEARSDQADPEPAPEPTIEAPDPEPVTSRQPVPVDAPTAAGMTERGVRLYNQGRIQESIDQFTKAIALDSNYVQAWARRAEAYARLGRGDEAAEDRRKLEALNPGS